VPYENSESVDGSLLEESETGRMQKLALQRSTHETMRRERMKRFMAKIGLVIVFCTTSALVVLAATQPPQVGGVLPNIVLEAPNQPEHQAYLGIKEKKSFTIPEIDARIVIIEIFSMY
jgi:hypothetical protein